MDIIFNRYFERRKKCNNTIGYSINLTEFSAEVSGKYGLLEPNVTNVHLVTYIERIVFFLVFPKENDTEISNFQIKNTHKICTNQKQNNTFSTIKFPKTSINTIDTP